MSHRSGVWGEKLEFKTRTKDSGGGVTQFSGADGEVLILDSQREQKNGGEREKVDATSQS